MSQGSQPGRVPNRGTRERSSGDPREYEPTERWAARRGDGGADAEGNPATTAEGEVHRDQSDRERRRRSRTGGKRRARPDHAEREQRAHTGEQPESIPVADRGREPVRGSGVEVAEMTRKDPRRRRVRGDQRDRNENAGGNRKRIPATEDEKHRRDHRECHKRPLGLVHAGAGVARP